MHGNEHTYYDDAMKRIINRIEEIRYVVDFARKGDRETTFIKSTFQRRCRRLFV